MDLSALFQLSYGIYLITSHDQKGDGGCLVNTVFQITAEPIRVAVSVSKHNHTHEKIEKSGTLVVNVVGEEIETQLLGRFGYRSGRDFNKFEGIHSHRDQQGDILIDEPGILSQISCKIVGSTDMDTHTIFVCDVVDATKREDGVPMTYNYFREVKKLKASKYAPTFQNAHV